MEKNDISPSQVQKCHRLSNTYQNKSNVARSLVDDNFMPYDNVDPDAFINVVQEDHNHVLLDDSVDKEWHFSNAHYAPSVDNDHTVIEPYDHSLSLNNNNSDFTDPFCLKPPLACNFTCSDVDIDILSDSDGTLNYDDVHRPPPEPPPPIVPEMTFTATAPLLHDLRSNPSACFLGGPRCCSPFLDNNAFCNAPHTCDFSLEANMMLSSLVTYDDTKPLLFPSKPDTRECVFFITEKQNNLLNALQSLSAKDIICTLNNNPSLRQSSQKD